MIFFDKIKCGIKSGLTEYYSSGFSKSYFNFKAAIALVIALIASASVHRIAASICLLFSGVLLFFLTGISQKHYGAASYTVTNVDEKSKKKKWENIIMLSRLNFFRLEGISLKLVLLSLIFIFQTI